MPEELVGKPVVLSDGTLGVVHSIDLDDLEHPYIQTGGKVIRSDENLFCAYMATEEDSVPRE